MGSPERKNGFGYCSECNNELEWVDITYNFVTSEDVIVYCDNCGNEIPIHFKGELRLLKGLSFSKKEP